MSKELGIAIKMMVELSLLAVLITIVIAFGNLSRSAQVHMEQRNNSVEFLDVLSEKYDYNGTVLRGSDLIECISKNIGYYHFFVYDDVRTKDDANLILEVPRTGTKLSSVSHASLSAIIGDQRVNYLSTIVWVDENIDPYTGRVTYSISEKADVSNLEAFPGIVFEAVGG